MNRVRNRTIATMSPSTIAIRTARAISRRCFISTTARLGNPPAQAARVSEVEDEAMDLLESRGIGMERLVEGYQRGGSESTGGNYRDYIKVRESPRSRSKTDPMLTCSISAWNARPRSHSTTCSTRHHSQPPRMHHNWARSWTRPG